MQAIKGEKFYVSLGYIDKKEINEVNVDEINNLIMETKDGTVYVDDSDKDNIITIPIMKVNDIQKSGDIFKLTVLVYSNKTKWVNKENDQMCKFNVIGLFGVRKENNNEIIRFIQFYKSATEYLNSDKRVINMVIEANEESIIGE